MQLSRSLQCSAAHILHFSESPCDRCVDGKWMKLSWKMMLVVGGPATLSGLVNPPANNLNNPKQSSTTTCNPTKYYLPYQSNRVRHSTRYAVNRILE